MPEVNGHYTMKIDPVVYERVTPNMVGGEKVAVPDISPALPPEVLTGQPEPK
jgi:hypothetical protein